MAAFEEDSGPDLDQFEGKQWEDWASAINTISKYIHEYFIYYTWYLISNGLTPSSSSFFRKTECCPPKGDAICRGVKTKKIW